MMNTRGKLPDGASAERFKMFESNLLKTDGKWHDANFFPMTSEQGDTFVQDAIDARAKHHVFREKRFVKYCITNNGMSLLIRDSEEGDFLLLPEPFDK